MAMQSCQKQWRVAFRICVSGISCRSSFKQELRRFHMSILSCMMQRCSAGHICHTRSSRPSATLQVHESHCPWRQRSSFDLLQLRVAKNPTPPAALSLNLRNKPRHLEFRETNRQTKTSAEIWRHQPELLKIVSLPWQFCLRSHPQLPVPHGYCRVHRAHWLWLWPGQENPDPTISFRTWAKESASTQRSRTQRGSNLSKVTIYPNFTSTAMKYP